MIYGEHHDLSGEIADWEEHVFLAKYELELLGWLPTSAVWGTLDRLRLERERLGQLLNLYGSRHNDRSATLFRSCSEAQDG